jgi:hypothetical protein
LKRARDYERGLEWDSRLSELIGDAEFVKERLEYYAKSA